MLPFRVLPLLVLSGCQSLVAVTDPADGSSGAVDPGASTSRGEDPVATTLPDPTETPPPVTTGTTESAEGTDSGTTGSDDGGGQTCGNFLCDPTGDTSNSIECSVWEQDCPPGEKCMPWANDGGNAWNALRCSPIDPDPDGVDEPCTVEGSGVSGIDSCVLGAMCWDVDPETNQGTCVRQCIGSLDEPACADPNRYCRLYGEAVLTLCFAACNPLEPETCAEGQGCYDDGSYFICAPDASGDGGAAADPCEYINACAPGLACVDSSAISACDPEFDGCCTPFCDLAAPSCPPTTTCQPYYEGNTAPPQHENLGICLGA